MTRERQRIDLWIVYAVALLVGVITIVPTGWRVYHMPSEQTLDFRPMEDELYGIVTEALSSDSIQIRQVELSATAVAAESLLDAGAIDRWSYTGQQLANIAHELRLAETTTADTSSATVSDDVISDLLIAQRIDRSGSIDRVQIDLNRGAFNIPSPFVERQRNLVTSRDARSGMAFIRDGMVDYFDSPSRIVIPKTYPSGWCAAVMLSDLMRGIRCRTAVGGLSTTRLDDYDIRFIRPDTEADSIGSLIARVRRGVMVEGTRVVVDTVPVRAGQTFRSAGFSTGFIAIARTGAIVDTQTINGRTRLIQSNARYGPIGLALARIQLKNSTSANIPLSVSPRLTAVIDSVIRAVVLRANRAGVRGGFKVRDAQVAAVDLAAGDVLVLAGLRDPGLGSFLPGTQNRFIGSAVKPMMAAAVLAAHPSLSTLTVSSGAQASVVDGHVMRRPFNAGCGGGTVDLRRAMRCSSNMFSAELLLRGLRTSNVPRDQSDTTRLEAGALSTAPVIVELEKIADAPSDSSGGELNAIIWTRNDKEGVGKPFADRNGGLLFEHSSPQFIGDDGRGPNLDRMVRIAYGQDWNQWTLLDAAAAFGRVATGRNVRARLMIYPDSARPPDFPWRGAAWHRMLLTGLTDVVRHPEGTASDVGARVDQLVGRPVRLVGKTGSPDFDDDDFLESNAFVGMVSLTPAAPDRPLDDGIAFALSVDYVDPVRNRDRAEATAMRRALKVHRELAVEVAVALANYMRTR